MTAVFLDTSYLHAILLKRDGHHPQAMKWRGVLRGPFLTTEYVLVEWMNGLAGDATRAGAVAAYQALLQDTNVTIVQATTGLLGHGFDLYKQRPDKLWSLTDCISFVVMREEGLSDALTADHHFVQAGFRALLLEEAG